MLPMINSYFNTPEGTDTSLMDSIYANSYGGLSGITSRDGLINKGFSGSTSNPSYLDVYTNSISNPTSGNSAISNFNNQSSITSNSTTNASSKPGLWDNMKSSFSDMFVGSNAATEALAKAGYGADFDWSNANQLDLNKRKSILAEEQLNQANSFDWAGGAGLAMSAFDTFGSGGSLDVGKANIDLANIQIAALKSNIENKNAFLSGTKSAFA